MHSGTVFLTHCIRKKWGRGLELKLNRSVRNINHASLLGHRRLPRPRPTAPLLTDVLTMVRC